MGGNSARKARNRKQVTPLDFQKFLPEYLVNQKWATHNMLRPSSVCYRRHLPPRGEGYIKGNYLKIQTVCNNSFVKLPLIRRRSATASRRDCLWAATRREKPPKGKPLSISNGLQRVRYETGDTRPRGKKATSRGRNFFYKTIDNAFSSMI